MKLLRTYLESCASIVDVVVAARPTTVSTKPVADAVRSRNPSKSTLTHDAVAAAVSHKHHSIIRVGAGLIQFVYKSHSRLATELTLDKLFSPWLNGFRGLLRIFASDEKWLARSSPSTNYFRHGWMVFAGFYASLHQMRSGWPWRMSPFHRRKHWWYAHTSLLAIFQRSHRVVLVPFCIIYSLHLIAAWFLQAIWLPEWFHTIAIISRLLCLQGTRGSFKYFPKNDLLSFCRNMKSAVHVPYAGWLILPCSALARTHDLKNFLSSIQAARPSLSLQNQQTDIFEGGRVSRMRGHIEVWKHTRRLSVLICLKAPVSFSSCFRTAAPLRIVSLTLLLNVKWRPW